MIIAEADFANSFITECLCPSGNMESVFDSIFFTFSGVTSNAASSNVL